MLVARRSFSSLKGGGGGGKFPLGDLRLFGIFAHVDSGKTTLTESLLHMSTSKPFEGRVDDGSTTTDYLEVERERGITVQSAGVGFAWNGMKASLLDTPGHVDFSVEVVRSCMVVDSGILVLDGGYAATTKSKTVEPQTKGHYNVMRRLDVKSSPLPYHLHPLPMIAVVNKLDNPLTFSESSSAFFDTVDAVDHQLKGCNPVPLQIPVYSTDDFVGGGDGDDDDTSKLFVDWKDRELHKPKNGDIKDFVGVIDLISLSLITWDNPSSKERSRSAPTITPIDKSSPLYESALESHNALVERIADDDDAIAETYLMAMEGKGEAEPFDAKDLISAIRRLTISGAITPCFAISALKGVGVQSVLDGIKYFLPSPHDRRRVGLTGFEENDDIEDDALTPRAQRQKKKKKKSKKIAPKKVPKFFMGDTRSDELLALAFKVVHLPSSGGKEGRRVVFVRVFSGEIRSGMRVRGGRDVRGGYYLNGSGGDSPPGGSNWGIVDRVNQVLSLENGDKFDQISGDDKSNSCGAGQVCAIIGLKNITTGDTITDASVQRSYFREGSEDELEENNNKVHSLDLAKNPSIRIGHLPSPPVPVYKLRVEPEMVSGEKDLIRFLRVVEQEDPSFKVDVGEEGAHSSNDVDLSEGDEGSNDSDNDSTELAIQRATGSSGPITISGMGELHLSIVLDRLEREFKLKNIRVGEAAVSYKDTIEGTITPDWFVYDKTIGSHRIEGSIHLAFEHIDSSVSNDDDQIQRIMENKIVISDSVKRYLAGEVAEDELDEENDDRQVDDDDEGKEGEGEKEGEADDESINNECLQQLKAGILNALDQDTTNVRCKVLGVRFENYTYPGTKTQPGNLRAVAAQATRAALANNTVKTEPIMNVAININDGTMIGNVLSDFSGRGGVVREIENDEMTARIQGRAPLSKILNYANELRTITKGEGSFNSEYLGHAPAQ